MNMSTSNQSSGDGILILSDLRFTDAGLTPYRIDSMFGEDSIAFSTTFMNYLDEHIKESKISIKYLLILGDITNTALKTEFNYALSFLGKLVQQYNIHRKNVLIIPGNHDVSRDEHYKYLVEHNIHKDKSHEHQAEKFSTFLNFYNEFYRECPDEEIRFNPEAAITRVLEISDMGVVFIGINTLYKESCFQELQHGEINRIIDTEIQNVHKKYPDQRIIACMHHLLKDGSYNDSIKHKYIANWDDLSPSFDREKITIFFSAGNAQPIHGGTFKTRKDRDYLICGSISPSSCEKSAYVLLKFEKTEQKTSLKVMPYKYETSNAGSYWQQQDSKNDIMDEILIHVPNGVPALEERVKEIEDEDVSSQVDEISVSDNAQISKLFYEKAEDYILEVIKKYDLYMLGDFRWDPKGHSISYIMTDFFFDNYVCFERVKEYYKRLLDEKVKFAPDLIIGYEMNGNIIGPLLAIEKGCDYTYLPARNRKHTAKEKQLPVQKDKYSTIVVVLDLIYTDNIIRTIVEIIMQSYPKVERLYFLSLIEGVREKDGSITRSGIDYDVAISIDTEMGASIKGLYAFSICQIPMISSGFNATNSKLFEKEIIPGYQLYSETDYD